MKLQISAHICLGLSGLFLVLEATWINKLWSSRDELEHALQITAGCGTVLFALISFYLFLYMRRPIAWFFAGTVILLYSGIAVPEGTEDLYELLRDFPEFTIIYPIRLLFTLFLFVPLGLFLALSILDFIRFRHRRKEQA
ncbi:MAG: hypothetical protein HQ581_08580 [Planctomycetes bacterium]|nr:hypothetical protein [Planctomycetota bacterium]